MNEEDEIVIEIPEKLHHMVNNLAHLEEALSSLNKIIILKDDKSIGRKELELLVNTLRQWIRKLYRKIRIV